MPINIAETAKSKLGPIVAMGKDIVSTLRDASLFFLAILLLAFPKQFNTVLVNAGFEEGSVVGCK